MTETKITGLLFQLAELDVTGILIVYSGSGGDGQIDDIVYTTRELHKDPNMALSEIDSLDTYSQDTKHLIDLDADAYDLMYDFVMDKILKEPYSIPDWYRYDGGYGHVSLLVPSGQYEVINTIYITDTDITRHKGDLLSKTED
jgi:hypothetical protein